MGRGGSLAILCENGDILKVYCGTAAPHHAVPFLLKKYNSNNIIFKLIFRGSISYLGGGIKGCTFHATKEKVTLINKYKSFDSYFESLDGYYDYIFINNLNKWFMKALHLDYFIELDIKDISEIKKVFDWERIKSNEDYSANIDNFFNTKSKININKLL